MHMNEENNMKEIYESKDKQIVPYLLIQQDVKFLGTRLEGSIVYFQFSPSDICELLINKLVSRKADPVQPKDLLDAMDTFKKRIYETKGGDI